MLHRDPVGLARTPGGRVDGDGMISQAWAIAGAGRPGGVPDRTVIRGNHLPDEAAVAPGLSPGWAIYGSHGTGMANSAGRLQDPEQVRNGPGQLTSLRIIVAGG